MASNEQDYELIKQFLAGNESAFNQIVNKYKQKIYWHARKMTGNHLDADEVLQEVLLTIYNKLSGFQFKSSLYTWIFRITVTRSINLVNKRNLRRFFSFDDVEIRYDQNVAEKMEDREKLEKLDKVLQSIPPKQREIFILRHYDELSYEEIAEITGKSVGGLKANYFHAFNKVSEMMND